MQLPFILVVASALVPGLGFAAVNSNSQSAVWSHHALIVDLTDLPKRYTCNELWYKFNDVLSAIGARPDMKILPYRCDNRVGSLAPKVELEFALPEVVTGKQKRWADMNVVPRSVQLAPGPLPHVDAGDCALLNQMRLTLLRSIGEKVTDFRLPCHAPPSAHPPFSLTVNALLPVTSASASVAVAPPNTRRGSESRL